MANVYKIEINGYGAEIVIGKISEESAQYFIDNEIDIGEYAAGCDDDAGVPEEFQPFEPGAWFECDNITHQWGPELSSDNEIKVTDASGKEVFTSSLDSGDLDDAGINLVCLDEIYIGEMPEGDCIFMGQSNEDGMFFGGEIETKGDFDITKLSISFVDVEDVNIIRKISYDGVELENLDSSTSGNSTSFSIICVGED